MRSGGKIGDNFLLAKISSYMVFTDSSITLLCMSPNLTNVFVLLCSNYKIYWNLREQLRTI